MQAVLKMDLLQQRDAACRPGMPDLTGKGTSLRSTLYDGRL